jgi:hypothetical protein
MFAENQAHCHKNTHEIKFKTIPASNTALRLLCAAAD